MAIAVDFAVLSGGTGEGKTHYNIPEFPVIAVYHATAVGVVNVAAAGGRFIAIRSKAGSDPVLLRFQADAVSTQAGAADAGTITIDPGERLLIGIPEDQDSAAYEFDIR